MTLTVVVHSYGYAPYLQHFLRSLRDYGDSSKIYTSVFCHSNDANTLLVAKKFNCAVFDVDRGKVVNRCYGRNLISLNSWQDWIWFASADLFFDRRFLGKLQEELKTAEGDAYFFRHVWECSRRYGDKVFADATVGPDVKEFRRVKHCKDDSGGTMIVRGDLCRKIGYMKNSIASKPVGNDETEWQPTVEDVLFRKQVGTWRMLMARKLYHIKHMPIDVKVPV